MNSAVEDAILFIAALMPITSPSSTMMRTMRTTGLPKISCRSPGLEAVKSALIAVTPKPSVIQL